LKLSHLLIIAFGSLILTSALLIKFSTDLTNPTDSSRDRLARIPVEKIVMNLKTGNVENSIPFFKNEITLNELLSFLGKKHYHKGKPLQSTLRYEIFDANFSSDQEFASAEVRVSISSLENDTHVDLRFDLEYNDINNRYLINSLEFDNAFEQLFPSLFVSPENLTLENLLNDPCELDTSIHYDYVKLKTRNSESSNNENIGFSKEGVTSMVTSAAYEDFHNTQIFEQVKFNKLVDDKDAPDPGYVLSIADLDGVKGYNGLPVRLFADVYDAFAVFFLKDQDGNTVNYPTGLNLDRTWNRLVVMASDRNQVQVVENLNNPYAVYFLNDFVYLLDDEGLKVFRLSVVQTAIIRFLYLTPIELIELDENLSYATDLSGYFDGNDYHLLISNSDGSIYDYSLNEGLPEDGEIITSYLDQADEQFDIPKLSRIEAVSNTDNSTTLMGIDQIDNIAYCFQMGEEGILLNNATYFPKEYSSTLINVGHNIGENAFYISDGSAHKIHVFNEVGSYLGSGGIFGSSDRGNELLFPNAISSNSFANNINEIVVGNRWGWQTGFKRIRPIGGITQLSVYEKTPNRIEFLDYNELILEFTLTAGADISRISLSINDELISELTNDSNIFLADKYSLPFLISDIEHALKPGWNTYTVKSITNFIDSNGNIIPIELEKEIEFFYFPSRINTDFILSENGDLSHSLEEPIDIYKNIYFGDDQDSTYVEFSDGQVNLLDSKIITVNENVNFYSDNELFTFGCGSKINLIVNKSRSKRLSSCTFDGQNKNYNMIQITGDITGGDGSGTANSKLEFLSNRFKNYYGHSVFIENSRATFINNLFYPENMNIEDSLYSSGIAAFSESRVDLRGNKFYKNDVGIDAMDSYVFIGHPSKTYDNLTIDSTLFKLNTIAYFAKSTYSRIERSYFEENESAIFDLHGIIDLERNSQNEFQRNHRAIVFSNELRGERAKNLFFDNVIDLTPVYPDEVVETVNVNLGCNYWEHAGISGAPVMDVILYDDKVIITYNPEMTKKENGNGNINYICNNGQGSNETQSGNENINGYSKSSKKATKVKGYLKGNDFTNAYLDITSEGINYKYLGDPYSGIIRQDYLDASSKNNTISFFNAAVGNKRLDSNDSSLLFKLYQQSKKNSHNSSIVKDRIELLKAINSPSRVTDLDDEDYEQKNSLSFYPNPAINEVTISIPNGIVGESVLVIVRGLEGKVLLTHRPVISETGAIKIDLNSVRGGLLLVEVKKKDGQTIDVVKVIKN
jgi:hypothetical protein